jgi:membrane protease YdiL (CAAX protease family)
MKSRIIWFVYALFFVFGVFLKTFATTGTFMEIGRSIDFSTPTLQILFQFVFYLALSALFIFLRKSALFAPKAIPAVFDARKSLIPAVLFLVSLSLILLGMHSLVSIPVGRFNSPLAVVLFGVTVVILAPFVEEIFYRRILLDHLIFEKAMSRPGAIVLGAILFYLPHALNNNYGMFILLFGLFVSIVFVYGRNIRLAMLFHGVYNAITMVSFYGVVPKIGKFVAVVFVSMAVFSLIAAFAMVIASVRSVRYA